MEAILVEPGNKEQFEKIKAFLEENNIKASFIDDEEIRFVERRKLADAAGKEYPQLDLTMDEIVSIVKESRAEEYAS